MKINSMKKNKIFSMVICSMLLLSILSILPMAEADVYNPPNDMDIEMDTNLDSVYVGEENVEFWVSVTNGAGSDEPGALNNANLYIAETGPFDWVVSAVEDDATIPEGTTYYFLTFEFHVDGNAPAGTYELTAILEYETDAAEEETYQAYIEVVIENNSVVLDAEPGLWAGVYFQEMEVDVYNDGDTVLNDIYLTVTGLPGGVSVRDDTAFIPGALPPTATTTAYFRVDVESDTDPGIYTADYELAAHRDGVPIEEEGTFDIVVNFTPRIEATIDDEVNIDQGTTEVTFEVTFENTGNVPLSDVYIGLIADDYFMIQAVDHYEYGDDVRHVAVPLGDLSVSGEGSYESMEFTIGLHRYLQDGLHKLMFRWDGWYYNDGSTGEATQYLHVGVDWDLEVSPNVALLYEVVEDDHRYNPDEGDIQMERPWDGPYAFLTVTSIAIDISGTAERIELLGDITYVQLDVTLHNHELVDFKDLMVQLEAGEDTPFYNPVDPTLGYVEMDPLSGDYLPADGTVEIFFNVDINTDFVQQRLSERSHAYVINVTITRAINVDTNEELSDFSIPISGELKGLGPRLAVEGRLEDNDIQPGEIFTLTYNITNHGDDTARDTWVTMRPELYDNENWSIVDGFIRAFATSSERYKFLMDIDEEEWEVMMEEETSKNTSHMEMDLFGVESGEDLVDLHLYLEGALSAPRPHIWTLYVGEIGPGESISVSFNMVSSKHMQVGQPYQETIEIQSMDSDGEIWNVTYPITIRTLEVEEEPEGIFGMEGTLFAVILIAIIIIIALIFVMMFMARTGEKAGKDEPLPESEEDSEFVSEEESSWAESSPLDEEEVEVEEEETEEVW